MKETAKIKKEIIFDIENREYIANKHVMRCFTIAMCVYLIAFLLNAFDIFIIDKEVMKAGFVPSVITYLIVLFVTKRVSLANSKMKYFILFSTILVFTFIGITITYHVVMIALLPISYATLYSSKKVMRYVYGLTVLSTIVIVYGGYYFGLCDANMALLTADRLENYIVDGAFILTTLNENPAFTLLLFFVIPRCLIQFAFMAAYNSILRIVEESLKKAAHVAPARPFQVLCKLKKPI